MRPQTYENAAEKEILGYVYSDRDGSLRNTSFALLSPKGEKLTRGSRSPMMTYGSAERFAAALKRTYGDYAKRSQPVAALPTLRTLRLGLNVAAADLRPLIVVRAEGAKAAGQLAERVAAWSWSEEHAGRAHFVVLTEETSFGKLTPELGVSVIQADAHGVGGRVLSRTLAEVSDEALHAGLAKGLAAHVAKDRVYAEHVREARRRGIDWKTEIPVADPGGGEGRGQRRGRRARGESGESGGEVEPRERRRRRNGGG